MTLAGFGTVDSGFNDQENPLDIGDGATATGTDGTAIGVNADASAQDTTALGTGATADTTGSVSIGRSANVGGRRSVAIGQFSNASGEDSVAIGRDANAAQGAVAIGDGPDADVVRSIAIGENISTSAAATERGVAIGYGTALGTSSVAVGPLATAYNQGVAIGDNAYGDGQGSISIGRDTSAGIGTSNYVGIAIGQGASITGNGGIAIGANRDVVTTGNVRIGNRTEASQTSITATLGNIADADLQPGDFCVGIDETNTQFVLRAKDSSGTVVSGTVGYS